MGSNPIPGVHSSKEMMIMAKPAKESGKEAKEPAKEGPKPEKKREAFAVTAAKPMMRGGKEIKGIVRLAGRDLKGEVPLDRALARIKGIGERMASMLSRAAYSELGLPNDAVIGELSDEQMRKLEEMMANPQKHGIPLWMLNRRRDIETGSDKHLIGTDLTFTVKQDIEREKETGTWIGYRHNYGQKVRGQHTRTTGRKGMTVGVIRKAILAKTAAAAAPAAGGAAPAAGAPAAAAPAAAPAAKTAAKPAAAPAKK